MDLACAKYCLIQSELNLNIDLTYIISKYKANIVLQVIERNVSIVVLMITHI